MPAVSKAQFRFMQGVAHGSIHKPGLSPEKAKEFVSGQHPKELPEHHAIKKIGKHGSRHAHKKRDMSKIDDYPTGKY